jgi:hypothetical protein
LFKNESAKIIAVGDSCNNNGKIFPCVIYQVGQKRLPLSEQPGLAEVTFATFAGSI